MTGSASTVQGEPAPVDEQAAAKLTEDKQFIQIPSNIQSVNHRGTLPCLEGVSNIYQLTMSSRKLPLKKTTPRRVIPVATRARLSGPPIAKRAIKRVAVPNQRTTPQGTTIISHAEMIRVLDGSVAFGLTAIAINPGNDQMFPWLSSVAPSFESYRFKKLRMTYRPSCSSLTPGAVFMAVDYDATDLPPSDIVTLMQNQHAVKSNVWDSVTYDLLRQGNDAIPKRYVLDNLPPRGTDPRLYNLGNFLVATFGQTAATYVGELYVDYTVELFIPQGQADYPSEATLIVNNTAGTALDSPFLGATAKSSNSHGPSVSITPNPTTGKLDSIRLNKAGTYILDCSATMNSGFSPFQADIMYPAAYTGSGVNITTNTTDVASLSAGAATIGSWILSYYPDPGTFSGQLAGLIYNFYAAAFVGKLQNELQWRITSVPKGGLI